jgi:hypothetical protein
LLRIARGWAILWSLANFDIEFELQEGFQMDNFQVGKEFQKLSSRLSEIEEAIIDLGKSKSCPCTEQGKIPNLEVADDRLMVELTDNAIFAQASKSYQWNRIETAKCTWDPFTVIFFEDGTVNYTGTVDCNTGRLFTCTFELRVTATLDDSSEIEAFSWKSEHGGVTRDANESRRFYNPAIKGAFARIRGGNAYTSCTCIGC